jgi:putative glutamine amidotransferase
MQLINVAEGGTLFEELAESSISHYIDPDGWINYHSISIVPNTLSSKLLGVNSYFVSSIHHQGVEKIGNNLKISAFAEDGVIEIIEHEDEARFIIGFQGHVEKIRKNQSAYDSIFKAFFERSKENTLELVEFES